VAISYVNEEFSGKGRGLAMGIYVSGLGSGSTIGGTISGAANIISGNAGDGVFLQGSGFLVAGIFVSAYFTKSAANAAYGGIDVGPPWLRAGAA